MTPNPGSLASQDAARLSREATVSPKAAAAVLSDLERRIEAIPPWTPEEIASAKAKAAADREKWTADARAALGAAFPLLRCLPQSYDRADVPKLEAMHTPAGYEVIVSIWTRRREEWNYDFIGVSKNRHATREEALAEAGIIQKGTP